ncbi:MAG: hypothetical protein JXB50_01525 [Spirochaetes bacterium]|nr:hypothetical protein [Spirochaetota bacterium]
MPVNMIDHKNKKIIYVDHRGLTGQNLLENYKQACELIKKNGSGCLMLVDFRDSTISNELVDYIKSDENKAITKLIAKQAAIGISGIKKIVFNLYNTVTGSSLKIFNTEDEAKNYLAS